MPDAPYGPQIGMPAMNPMTPDNQGLMLNYLMQQGGAAQQQQEIARKQALLTQLRSDTALPGMIQGGGARTVKAASPLSAIADIGGKLIGGYKQKKLDEQASNIAGQSRSDLANLIEEQRQAKQKALPLEQRAGYQPQPTMPSDITE
jgi:hypothetical protein